MSAPPLKPPLFWRITSSRLMSTLEKGKHHQDLFWNYKTFHLSPFSPTLSMIGLLVTSSFWKFTRSLLFKLMSVQNSCNLRHNLILLSTNILTETGMKIILIREKYDSYISKKIFVCLRISRCYNVVHPSLVPRHTCQSGNQTRSTPIWTWTTVIQTDGSFGLQ